MKYQWQAINLEETNRLRAFAILIIITHNFLHWVMDTPGENEFHFAIHKYNSFIYSLSEHPLDSIRILSTYLGHYGVQIFFFLSGYGVAIKYNSNNPPSWASFIKKRLTTLYIPIIIAALGYLIYESFRQGSTHLIQSDSIHLIRQMLGISNLTSYNVYNPIGPWWFIGVILHFYLIAPLILKQKKYSQPTFLLAIILSSLLAEYYLGPTLSHHLSININHTILGQLDICAFGMLLAQFKQFTLSKSRTLLLFTSALTLFILGNYHSTLWILTSLTASIILIPTLRHLGEISKKISLLDKFILLTGNLSIYLFLSNGYLRKPLINYAKEDPTWWKSITLCILFLILTYTWSICLRFITQKTTTLFTKKTTLNHPK